MKKSFRNLSTQVLLTDDRSTFHCTEIFHVTFSSSVIMLPFILCIQMHSFDGKRLGQREFKGDVSVSGYISIHSTLLN